MQYLGVTSLPNLLICPRRFQFQSIQRLEPNITSTFLSYGTLMHAALEGLYLDVQSGKTYAKAKDGAITCLLAAYEKEEERLVEELGDFSARDAKDTLSNQLESIQEMLTFYIPWAAKNDNFDKIISVEEKLSLEVMDDITLRGRLDLVVEKNGLTWIIDHKTRSRDTGQEPALAIDSQITAYVWLYYQVHGVIANGMMHNIIKRVEFKEPTLLSSGKMSRANIFTTHDRYMQALLAAGLNPEEYSSHLQQLQQQTNEDLFDNLISTRTPEQLRAFETMLEQQIMLFKYINEYDLWTPNPTVHNCRFCNFLSVCDVKEHGGDYERVLRENYRPREVS